MGERQPIQLDGGEEAADKAEEEEEEEEEERKQQVRENSLEEDDVLDEEDNTVKCLVCDKAFPDVYMYVPPLSFFFHLSISSPAWTSTWWTATDTRRRNMCVNIAIRALRGGPTFLGTK